MATIATLVAEFGAKDAGFNAYADKVASKMKALNAQMNGFGASDGGVNLAKAAAGMKTLSTATEGSSASLGEMAEKFGHMGRVLSRVSPELGHMAHATHLLTLLSDPLTLAAVAFAAVAVGVIKFTEANAKLDESLSELDDALITSNGTLAAVSKGWDAYYAAISDGASVVDAARKREEAAGKGALGVELDDIHKKQEELKKAIDVQIAIKAKADAVLQGKNDTQTWSQFIWGASKGDMLADARKVADDASNTLAKLNKDFENISGSGTQAALAVGDVKNHLEDAANAAKDLAKNDLAAFFTSIENQWDPQAAKLSVASRAYDTLKHSMEALVAAGRAPSVEMYKQAAALLKMKDEAEAALALSHHVGTQEAGHAFARVEKVTQGVSMLGKDAHPLPGWTAALSLMAVDAQVVKDKLEAAGLVKVPDLTVTVESSGFEFIDSVRAAIKEWKAKGTPNFLRDVHDSAQMGVGILARAANTGNIASVTQGLQEGASAGPIGMAVGVAAELITKSKQFAKLLESVNGFLQVVADTLGSVIQPILPLFTMFRDAIQPILSIFAELAPILIEMNPVFILLKIQLRALEWASKALYSVFKSVAIGFLEIIRSVEKKLGISTKSIDKALTALKNSTWDSVNAMDNLNGAAQAASDSLTNIPDGFKYMLRRFQSMDAGGALGGGQGIGSILGGALSVSGSGISTQSYSMAGGGGGVTIHDGIHLHGVQNVEDLHRELKRLQRRENTTRFGVPVPVT